MTERGVVGDGFGLRPEMMESGHAMDSWIEYMLRLSKGGAMNSVRTLFRARG